MDGIHDLGGKQGYGPVQYTLNATAFHSPWEVRVNAMYAHAVRRGIFNMDEYRHAIERMDPRHYLTASYFERSLTGFATLPVERACSPAKSWSAERTGPFRSRRRALRAGATRRSASTSSPAIAFV
jgi:nitrile hydratase